MTPGVVDPHPRTDAEAHLRIARWAIGPHELLAVADGRVDDARSSVSAGHAGRYGAGERVQIDGHVVTYAYHDTGVTGTVRVRALLQLAADALTPATLQALRDASRARAAAVQEEIDLFGYSWLRPRDHHRSDAWIVWCRRRDAVERAYLSAAAAVWDTPPPDAPVQLDLFAEVSA